MTWDIECYYAECRNLFIIMENVVMVSAVMLSVIMQSGIIVVNWAMSQFNLPQLLLKLPIQFILLIINLPVLCLCLK
jgi:hypothetical protein